MRAITTVGLDIAKSVFQIHGIDAEGNMLISGASLGLGVFPVTAVPLAARARESRSQTLKDHWDKAITHTGRIVSIALILTK